MKKAVTGFFAFLVLVALVVALLRLINWLPVLLHEESLRRYESLEAVRTSLHLEDLHVPSYFPESFRWPPARILAQGEPFVAVAMEFAEADTGKIGLLLTQVAEGGHPLDVEAIRLQRVREEVPYDLKGRRATLRVGDCASGGTCSSLSWKEGGYTLRLVMAGPPFELIRMASSMVD
jgi:hypothetical protein